MINEKKFLFTEVMIVDDDELDHASCMRAFKKINFAEKAISFKTAEAALSLFTHPTSRLPELLLMDVNIPRINGLELIERASTKLRQQNVVVALLLSCPLPRDLHNRAAENPDIAAFINKPVQSQALLSLAQNVWDKRRQSVSETL
ncbi:MAG: response regulator [Pseudomonadota bacterium]